jgi:hypothetical protein
MDCEHLISQAVRFQAEPRRSGANGASPRADRRLAGRSGREKAHGGGRERQAIDDI